MRKIFFIVLFLFAIILPAEQNFNSKIYDKVKPISIKDYRAYMTGTLKQGDLFHISLKDVGLFTGHICPGTTSGYLMVKKALKKLYPNSIPIRGNFEVISSGENDLLEVAEYVLSPKSVKVDKNISKEKGILVLVIKRLDNNKSIKASFFKKDLIKDKKKFEKLKKLKAKIASGKGNAKEIKKVSSIMLKKVKMIINGKMDHLYKYNKLK